MHNRPERAARALGGALAFVGDESANRDLTRA
jgi:hypothetical protein